MGNITVTLVRIQSGDNNIYTFPTPTATEISVGANYILDERGSGSKLYDVLTTTWYDIVESAVIVQAMLDALETNVNITNTTDDGSSLDVFIQDQHTPVVVAYFTQTLVQTTTSAPTAIDDITVEVTSATGLVIGQHFTLFNPAAERFYFSKITNIASTTITVDSPLDFAFPSGSFVDAGSDNLAVDGSVTTQVFGLRGMGTPPGVDLEFDCTRIIFQCKAATAVDLAKFGDLTALTNGVLLRTRDGVYKNLFNLKDNGEIANICFDLEFYAATNPIQGQDGFTARITFAGQNKMGVTIRLGIGEDLEALVQDDLSGLLDFKIIAEGHIVTP